MIQGVTFTGDGPMMEGTWYNPSNGDHFTVRDSFFEDNQYIVTTTDGRTLSYNQIQNYIKSDKPITVEPKKAKEEVPAEIQALLEETESSNDMLPEDAALLGNLYSQPISKTIDTQSVNPISSPIVPNNNYIIEKALAKTTIPSVTHTPKWKNFPKREIDMLMELMDISKEEIIDWYMSKLDKETLYKEISKSLKDYVTNMLTPEIPEEPKPKTTAKKTKTNSK